MRKRPLMEFIRFFEKERPPSEIRSKLIRRYNKGGLKEFEPEVKLCLGDVPLGQIVFTDPVCGDRLLWVYVGDCWWCRKHRKCGLFEFSRLVARRNDKVGEVVGLWDVRAHGFVAEPEVVYDVVGNKGVIVGFNEFEVVVVWFKDGVRGVGVPVRGGLRFEFVEDYVKYRGILKDI